MLNALATKRLCSATEREFLALGERASYTAAAMHFLKTVFWVLVAVVVVLFAGRNWFEVTINLWGDIQADIKLPVLLLIVFLIGFLPTWLVMRARVWSHRRRIEAMERNRLAALPPETAPAESEAEPAL